MLTCIPTTYHALNFMMNEPAYWVGEPQLVVNMNVSWVKYAPLWILERIPEVYDLAEKTGADPLAVDRWRINNLPGVVHFFREIFENDQGSNIDYFSAPRLVSRMKHLEYYSLGVVQKILERAGLKIVDVAMKPDYFPFPEIEIV